VEVPEHRPTILPREVVDFLLRQIPEKQRGPYLLAARMGLRPGEVRALDVSDVSRSGKIWRLNVSKAVQGPHSGSKIGPTKNRRDRVLPVHPEVREWLEHHIDWTGRLRRAPLFTNPVSHKRLSHTQFYEVWYRVRQGVTDASLYQGTKHSFASDALESGIDINRIRKFLGHSDPRSTERYAKLSDKSLDIFAER
jgi:integrase